MNKNSIRSTNLLIIIGVILIVSSMVGSAAPTFISSKNVLEIDGNVGSVGGPLKPSDYKISGTFDAGVVNWNQITVGSFSSIGSNDTVILFQVNTSTLTATQRTTLLTFVTGGGKLIIWDSDAGATPGVSNDYSWLPVNLVFNTSVPGQLGAVGGKLQITEDNDLSNSSPADSKFINTTLLVNFTDAVGDANVVKTNGTDWCQDMFAQNAATPPQSGPGHMYSKPGGSAVNGFIVYSALDWDDAGGSGILSPSSAGGQLRKMLQFELMVNSTSKLPCNVTVVTPPPKGQPGKVVGSGNIGSMGSFNIWVYSHNLPQGAVKVNDNAGNKIVATWIDSVITDKTVSPKTGEITGKAMFNKNGPFDFVVKVTDGGEPSYAPFVSKDTFELSIPAKNYHIEGKLTRGNIQVIY